MAIIKKAGVLFLCATMVALSACGSPAGGGGDAASSSSSGTDSASGSAMGRFVEKPLAFPQGIPIAGSDMMYTPDHTLEIMVSHSQWKFTGPWSIYTSSDEGASWTVKDTPWLHSFDESTISGADYDRQGNLYLLTVTYSAAFDALLQAAMETGVAPLAEEYPPYILYKIDPQGTAKEIPIDWKKDKDGGVTAYDVLVADTGEIIVDHYEDCVAYDPATGKQLHTFLAGDSSDYFVYGSTFAAVGENEIRQFNVSTGDSLDPIPLEGVVGGIRVTTSVDEKALYRCDGSGIYRYILGGSVWERIVDGELTSLNIPSIYISSMVPAENGDFLVMTGSEEGLSLLSFAYDAQVPTVPEKEMVVYMLHESDSVRQTAGLFQRSNPDIRVRLSTALGSEGAPVTSDAIRALNVELLAGKGPDVLVLDGLPMQSYMDKGVLTDLSASLAPLIESGSVIEGMANACKKDNSIYGMPTRFAMPHMWGSSDLIAQGSSIVALADWTAADHAANPGARQLYRMKPEELIEDYYATCAPAWKKEDGSMNAEKLGEFLSSMKKLADTAVEPDLSILGSYAEYMGFENPFAFMQGLGVHWANQTLRTVTGLSTSFYDVAAGDAVVQYRGTGAFAPMAGQAQDVFIPIGILGVNTHSSQKDKALTFVQLALSDEVQGVSFDEGYPVNSKALEKEAQNPYAEGDDGMQSMVFEPDGSMKVLFILWPNASFMESLVNQMKKLSTPSVVDPNLIQMIIDESRDYFANGKSLDETVNAIAQRAQAYLGE